MSDAPKRLYADHGPNGGLMYRNKRKYDTIATFTNDDIVEGLVTALERCNRYGVSDIATDALAAYNEAMK